jgi:DNA-binding CsgD family transcriptional regulator/DNA replicative helicase MCM subunit Mcm2 (Cdc46/Mcm family)
MIGRASEQAALLGALDDARDGTARSVLLVGDAGMGKTTLLQAVERHAQAAGCTVVRTASPEGAELFRYGVVEDLVRALPVAGSRIPAADAALLTTLSHNGAVGPDRVATALLHLLGALDATRPVVLLLDDLHWADSASLAALTLAVGRLVHHPIAVVGTARPRPTIDPRLYAWDRIDVGPLDWASAIEVLRGALPADLAEDLSLPQADRIVGSLGRHPLALAEITRLLTPGQIAGTEQLPDPLPLDDRLRAAWGGAYRTLPERTRTAMLALCLARGSGPEVLDGLLAECGLSRADLDAAVDARLLVAAPHPQGSPDLAHSLVCAAVVGGSDSGRVRGLHRDAARLAAALGLSPAIAIAHLSAAGEPGDTTWAQQLCDQAQRALELDLGVVAARALLQAARGTDAPAQRAALAVRAARALLTHTGGTGEAGPLLEFLDGLALSTEQRVWALWLRAEHLAHQRLPEALAALCAAAEHAQRCGSSALPRILWSATFMAWSVGDGASALDMARRLAALQERDGATVDAALPAWAGRALLGLTLFQVGEVDASVPLLAQARAMAAAWSPDEGTGLAALANAVTLDEAMGTGLPPDDERLHEALRRLAGDHGDLLAFLRNIQASRLLRQGELAAARAVLDEGLSLSRATASTPNILLRLCSAVRIDATRGDAMALDAEARELRQLSRRLGNAWGLAFASRMQGLLALGEGRPDDALAFLEPLLDEDLLLGLSAAQPVLLGRADLVEALVRADDAARAAGVLAGLVATLDGLADPSAEGLLARARGLLATGPEAVAALEAGIDGFRRAGDAFELARTRLLLGEQLRRDRRTAQARLELRAAATEFERMSARPWLARCVEELRASGAGGPAAPTRGAAAALTAQEHRVAAAVAQGLTNREVAAALFVSPRTVEHHLASAYRKLGVRGRTALAACLLAEASSPEASPGLAVSAPGPTA